MLGSACNFYDDVLFKRNFTLKYSFVHPKYNNIQVILKLAFVLMV